MPSEQRLFLTRALLLSTALAALGWGYLRGEMGLVWQKAITICLECIGIG